MNRREFVSALIGATAGVYGTGIAGCRKMDDSRRSVRFLGEDSSNVSAIASYLKQQHEIATVEAADFVTALQKSTSDFAGGAGYYDVVLQYNFSLATFARNNYVYRLDQLKALTAQTANRDYAFEHDILPNVWKELSYYMKSPFHNFDDCESIGYPFAANTMVLVCNKAIFSDPILNSRYKHSFGADLAIPTTWDKFVQLAAFFSSAGKGIKGLALQGSTGGWLYYEWMNILYNLGGSVMNKQYGWQSDLSTPLSLVSDASIRAAELYVGLKPYNAGDFFSVDATAQIELLKTGKVAMALTWSDYLRELVNSRPDQFAFSPVPGQSSMIAGGTYFVNKQSHSAARAFEIICSLMEPEAQVSMALSGLLPPTRSALSNSRVLAVPYMQAVKDSLERGRYMLEAGPDSEIISREITSAIQSAWLGKLLPKDIPATAVQNIMKARRQ